VVLAAGAYRVLCFPDGAALMAVARSRTPNCIPLDMHLPRKPGLDVRKEHHVDDHPGSMFMISGQGDIAGGQGHQKRRPGFHRKAVPGPRNR
jgi:FixJ family two-component response regulator